MGHVLRIDTTYTGNPVSFNAAHGVTMKSVSVPLTPIQDLHGYANPWPAGGGKNKWDFANPQSATNASLTDNNDGTFSVSGTAASAKLFYLVTGLTANQLYSIKIEISDQQGNTGVFGYSKVYDGADATAPVLLNSVNLATRKEFTPTGSDVYIEFGVTGGSGSGSAICVEPTIESGNTITTFAPYSNICPISGRTGVSVYVSPTQDPDDATTYAVDWTTEAGTVYGGTLDVVTGVLTVDKKTVVIDGSVTGWETGYGYGNANYVPLTRLTSDQVKQAATGKERSALCLTNRFKPIPSTWSESFARNNEVCFGVSTDDYFVFNTGVRISDVPAWLNENPINFVYELATPLTYQLTPKQIAALIGQNYIWSSNNETLTAVLTAPETGFAGWLIKCVTNGTPVEIPLKYMRAETYTVTPDQRMEWSAERDVTGVLHRETVQNLPPKIEFNTPLMTNSEINALNSIIKAAFTSYLQRNITIQFYDPERNEYWEWDCYMPDVKYHIRNADTVNNIINYEELRYAFIGY